MKTISVIQSDITTLNVDAIVNSAKSSLTGGSGVDGAIHRAAGPELLEECLILAPCLPGSSVISNAYRLPCRFVIHTVGPVWRGGDRNETEVLASCYRSALDIALDRNFRSIAFPCISVGAFRMPHDLAAQVAVSAAKAHPFDGEVIFCCYADKDKAIYDNLIVRA